MPFSLFIFDYLTWHYKSAPGALFHVWHNLLRFLVQFFALYQHALTLFSPWHRVTEQRHKKFDFEDFAGVLLVNTISRLIGFVFRTALILVGSIAIVLWSIGLIVAYTVWLLAPLIVVSSIFAGIALIFIFYGIST